MVFRLGFGALLLAFALPGNAELLYRSLEQSNGQQRWSQFKRYSPADAAASRSGYAEEVRVVLSGEITRSDVDSAAVMAVLVKDGRQKLSSNSVWFASNGGDMDAAMDLGRLLRELGVSTAVGKDDQCLSACTFAFMGGERRSVAGRLGIHRPFFPYTQDVPGRQLRYRHLQRTLKAYVEEMDFPASFYEAVMLVPSESMKFLSPAELKTYFLEGISPSSEDLADAAAARHLGLSMIDYLKVKAKGAAQDVAGTARSGSVGRGK
jgi:hypothetical protein